MFRNDPRNRFLGGDNYEVNHEAFDLVKKTLIRISRLVSFPADDNLWMPVAGHPDKVRVVIRNANELSQFWPWGALYQNMIPEMKTVLESKPAGALPLLKSLAGYRCWRRCRTAWVIS